MRSIHRVGINEIIHNEKLRTQKTKEIVKESVFNFMADVKTITKNLHWIQKWKDIGSHTTHTKRTLKKIWDHAQHVWVPVRFWTANLQSEYQKIWLKSKVDPGQEIELNLLGNYSNKNHHAPNSIIILKVDLLQKWGQQKLVRKTASKMVSNF